jgi:SAM-dependent methyltransferase
LSFEELIGRVRADVAARRLGVTQSAAPSLELPRFSAPGEVGPLVPPLEPIAMRPEYSVYELLAYVDFDFVRNAYRALLGREPDEEGLGHQLLALRSGRISKLDLLRAFHESGEGRNKNVKVRGLGLATLAFRWRDKPVLGHALRLLERLVGVATILANLERHETVLHQRVQAMHRSQEAMARVADELNGQTAAAVQSIGNALRRLEAEKASAGLAMDAVGAVAKLHRELARFQAARADDMARVSAAIRDLGESRVDKEVVHRSLAELSGAMGAESSRLERRLQDLSSVIGTLAAGKADRMEVDAQFARQITRKNLESVLAQDDHRLDEFYVAFEERFRGPEADIRERMEMYLPIVKAAAAGRERAPVLDVGCGRGEWLDLLTASGLVGRGLDLNKVMVAHCRQRGLDVVEADLLAYLEGLAPDSLGAITAMHVVEHMPFARRIEFLDAALRALRPGGVAIMETPNPENLIVGACTFWNDPTHIQPLPPEPLQAAAELRGFVRVEIMRLRPYPFEAHLPKSRDPIRDSLNHLLFGPQDYAIVAHKAGSPPKR